MNAMKTSIVLFILILILGLNACETAPVKSQSCSASQMCGVQGSPGEWTKYWGP